MRLVWLHNKLTMSDTCTRLCGHFGTLTEDLEALADWLKTCAVFQY